MHLLLLCLAHSPLPQPLSHAPDSVNHLLPHSGLCFNIQPVRKSFPDPLSNIIFSSPEEESQSCPTLCDPMDYSVHRILQARILEWVAFPFSRGSSQPRDRTQASHITGGFFTSWALRKVQEYWSGEPIPSPVDLPDPGIKLGLLHCMWILHQLSY